LGTGILLVAVAALGFACANTKGTQPRYGFELAVAPSEDETATYKTVVTVRDLDSGKVVVQPKLFSSEGQPATIEASDRAAGIDFTITVEIGTAGRIATYRAELRDADGVVTTQDATVELRPS